MKIKIVLKTKDEDALIDLWIRYYSRLVGVENLVIFDNGSTSQVVRDCYKRHGVAVRDIALPNMIHNYVQNRDFYEDLYASCDWFAVLDTDEFLCAFRDGVFSADGVLDVLREASCRALGSTWMQHMHLGDSMEYFKAPGEHQRLYGKTVFRTDYERLRKVIHCHNVSCKDERGNCDAMLDSGLYLLHIDRLDAVSRVRNNVEMCLRSSETVQSKENAEYLHEIHSELEKIKVTGQASARFLEMKFPDSGLMWSIHKLREIQLYYSDKYAFLKQHYGTEREYVRTNLLRHVLLGDVYQQEIATPHFPPKG